MAKSAAGIREAPLGTGRWILSVLLLLYTLLVALHGEAHRGHAVWTDITWAQDRFEIVHRMHLADAITVNRYMGGTEAIEALRSLARVALYVDERFTLLGNLPSTSEPAAVPHDAAPDVPLNVPLSPTEASTGTTLNTIGAEIEDDFIFVYQEWVTPLPTQFPIVDNFVLLDVEPEAQAFIKIKGPGLNEERER